MYVTTVANLKKVKDKNVIDKMKMVLNETLRSRYYAVCIDLDGTLVNEKLDSSESLDIISKLLNNNIPIVLTTGRGESSTRQFVEEICQKLEDSKKSRNDLFKLISCICNNGAILMYSSGEREKILDTVTLLPKEKDVEMLTSLGVELNTDLKRKYNEKVTVIPSYSETLDKITNVRFRINDKNIANSLLEDLYKKISDRRPSSEIYIKFQWDTTMEIWCIK